jgi:hypothetical protein
MPNFGIWEILILFGCCGGLLTVLAVVVIAVLVAVTPRSDDRVEEHIAGPTRGRR